MTTHKEVLTLALETHSKNESHRTLAETRYWCDQYKFLAKTAIEALAQPEQEPLTENGMYRLGYHNGYGFGEAYGKANAPQRTWVGLTEDEAFACQGRNYFETYKAIEAKLKEKNT